MKSGEDHFVPISLVMQAQPYAGGLRYRPILNKESKAAYLIRRLQCRKPCPPPSVLK
jgi:hypothetical protein